MGTEAEAPFAAIVLAAGAGSRFGGGKLLAPFRRSVLLDGALSAAFAAPAGEVILVTGAQAEAVAEAALKFAQAAGQADRLRVVHAHDHAEGMGASLREGALAVREGVKGVFVFLGDMPRVPVEVLAPLARAVEDGAPAAAAAFGGRRGHPVVFAASQLAELRKLSGDAGARDLLRSLGASLRLIEAPDDGVLLDVDTPADLSRAAGLDS